jgi:hypothetical protein
VCKPQNENKKDYIWGGSGALTFLTLFSFSHLDILLGIFTALSPYTYITIPNKIVHQFGGHGVVVCCLTAECCILSVNTTAAPTPVCLCVSGGWKGRRKKAKEKTGHRAGTSCADKRENSSSGPGCRLSVIDRFVNVSSHR